MSKKYTDKELANILAEVEVEFQKHLKPAAGEEKLAKTESAQAATAEKTTEEVAYDAEDMAEVEKMYKSMEKSEAEIHYKAVKKAMFGEAGEEKITKSESTEEDKLLKSENEALKAENEELKKSFGKVTEAITKMFQKPAQAPKQKAVTSIEVMKKSEEDVKEVKKDEKDVSKLSAQQINAALSSKIRNGDLKKSDKEAVQKYFDTNKTNIELVKHLL